MSQQAIVRSGTLSGDHQATAHQRLDLVERLDRQLEPLVGHQATEPDEQRLG
jgi:hypothetical protein